MKQIKPIIWGIAIIALGLIFGGNALGLFIGDYVQAVKEAGNVWAVPVIDWNSTSGLYPMHENEDYFGHENDRLHPNDKGQERMARTLMYQLLTLPCQF